MQISGQTPPGSPQTLQTGSTAFALAIDSTSIVMHVGNTREAYALPCGTVIGDLHGGLTFTDAVAAVLESRSIAGWQEMPTSSGDVWTVIVLNR